MSGVSESDLERLREYTPELLQSRFGVYNVERQFCCPNPAHDDRDPSAKYYPDKHLVHCFGCQQTWDVFKLIGMADGIDSFPDQVQAVADAVGYGLEDVRGKRSHLRNAARRPAAHGRSPQPFERPRVVEGPDLSEACRDAYEALFTPEGDIGRRYLHWRGFDDADIVNHGLGFTLSPHEFSPTFRVYEPDALGFVVVPFWDELFTTATFCMLRTVCKPGTARCKEWRPKGLASPLWREWLLTSGQEVVYVVEGLLDAMALEKMLHKPTVGLGGVGYAKRLSSLLYHTPAEKRPGKVVVCTDEDDEGRKAADKIARDLDAIGIPHATLPPYPGGAKDANEWLMAGRGVDWDYDEEPPRHQGLQPIRSTRWL